MFYASYSLLSLVLHLITNTVVFRTKNQDLSAAMVRYKQFLMGMTVFYVSDILWGLLYELRIIPLIYADTVLFFFSMIVSVLLWSRFTVSYLDKKDFFSRFLPRASFLILVFEIMLLGVNLFEPVIFGFNEAKVYVPGFGRYVTLVIQILLFTAVFFHSFFYATKTEGKVQRHYGTIAVSGLVMTVFIILQTTNCFLPFYAIGCLVACCLVNSFLAEDIRTDHALELGAAVQKQLRLEETVKLKDQLLEQEVREHKADAMVTAMAAEYRSVYYIDLDKDEATCYRANSELRDGMKEGDTFSFRERFRRYAEKYVSDEDMLGFLEFIDPDNIRLALKKEPVAAYRYLFITPESERYYVLRISAVRRPGERTDDCIHAVGMGFSDVDTETRESMEQTLALSDALNQAEEASYAKTAFLSSMSHEIRTPMNAIIGFNTIALKDPSLSDETRDYLEKIGASAKHLLSLINDILDMSRIESGRMILHNEEFSIRETLDQINTIILGQCQEKGLDYDVDLDESLDDYYIGDDMKLRQVLINILGNAVKYTPAPGRVAFEAKQMARFDGNATLRFIVKDTGIGMDEDFIPKIFSVFTQENEFIGNAYGSTGLGMAISKSIVEMMNGKINVESKKGSGSSFTLTVTLKTTDRIDRGPSDEVRPQDLRVLLIDDDELALLQAQMVLDDIGILTDVCHSGKEAYDLLKLSHARQETYDLILVDRMMPVQDGLEVSKTIRDELNDQAAIFLLTGYAWDHILDEAKSAGIDDFLSKPLVTSEVLEKFNAVIQSKKIGNKETKKTDLTGKHILMAEDMDINAEIMKQLLLMNQMTVDVAKNGQICVDMFRESDEYSYAAILMDIRMPVKNGISAAEDIRALERPDAKTIPIIAMTANAFDEDVQRSLQAGMNAHLTKPVDVNVLLESLRTLIQD